MTKLAQPDAAAPRPVFVITSWRSGSSLLMSMLGAHKRLVALPEMGFLDSFLARQCERVGNNMPALARSRPAIINVFNSTISIGTAEEEFYGAFAAFVDRILSGYATKDGATRWVYKEFTNADSLELIDLLFGYRATFVWLVRHGLDVVSSHIDRYERRTMQRASPHDYAVDWAVRNSLFADFCDRTPCRSVKVRYEDLVCEPQRELTRICSCIGEAWDDALLETMQRTPVRLGGDPRAVSSGGRPDTSSIGRWKAWPPAYRRQFGSIVNPMLHRAGYDTVEDCDLTADTLGSVNRSMEASGHSRSVRPVG